MPSKVEILIVAKDEASKALKEVHAAMGELSGASMLLKGGLIAAGAGLTVLGAGLLTSVKEAMGAQNAIAQLDAVLKSTKGTAGVTRKAALDLSESLGAITRFSHETVLETENMLLTFTSIGKRIFPQATETVLNMAQALGEDTKNAAIQLGKALNDPIHGVTALRRVGVQFTDDQKKMIEQLVKSGQLEKAQAVILKELQTEFGGSARAAGQTFAGQLERLQHRFVDLQEKIGSALLPILQKLADMLLSVLSNPAIEKGAELIGELFVGLVGLFTDVNTGADNLSETIIALGKNFGLNTVAIANFISGGIDLLKKALGELNIAWGLLVSGHVWSAIIHIGEAFGTTEAQMKPFADAFKTLQGFFFTTLVPTFNEVKDAIGRVADAFKRGDIGTALEIIVSTFAKFAARFWEWVTKDVIPQIPIVFNQIISTVSKFIADNWPGIEAKLKEWGAKFWEWLSPVLSSAASELKKVVDQAASELQKDWPTIDKSLREWAGKFWNWLGDVLNTLAPELLKLTAALKEWVESGDVKDKVREFGKSLGGTFIDGIGEIFSNKEKVQGTTNQLLPTLSQSLLNIYDSVARLGAEFISSFFGGIASRITSPGAADDIRQLIFNMLMGIANRMRDNEIKLPIFVLAQGMLDWFLNAIKTLDWERIGREMVDGIIRGVGSMQGALERAAERAGRDALDGIKRALGISSPSRAFMQIGALSMQGMALGIAQNAYQPAMAAVGAAQNITGTTNNYFNQTINTSAPYEPILQDFAMLRSIARS